jgi:hypothetical protein
LRHDFSLEPFARGHRVIAGPRGAASARSSPSARKGRSEAEWFDGDEDRRTIRPRDGRRERPPGRSAREPTNERDAQVGRQEGGDDQVTLSGVDSVRVRVHLHERRFRRKPDRRIPIDGIHAGVTPDVGCALGGVTDRAWFRRTTATCIWGVSDPPFQSAESRQEGGRGGRSRPRCLAHRGRRPRSQRHGRHGAPPAGTVSNP